MAGNGALIRRQTEVAEEHISTAYGSHYECMSHTWPKVGQRSLIAHVAVLVGSPRRLVSSQLHEPMAHDPSRCVGTMQCSGNEGQ